MGHAVGPVPVPCVHKPATVLAPPAGRLPACPPAGGPVSGPAPPAPPSIRITMLNGTRVHRSSQQPVGDQPIIRSRMAAPGTPHRATGRKVANA